MFNKLLKDPKKSNFNSIDTEKTQRRQAHNERQTLAIERLCTNLTDAVMLQYNYKDTH